MKTFMTMVAFLGLAGGCMSVRPGDESGDAARDAEVASSLTRTELENENLALKRENRRLRRALVRQSDEEPKIDLSTVREKKGAAGEEVNGKATDDGGFWLTTEKMRRHNSKCRYYRLGRGRPCRNDEGTPCRRCGG